MALINGSFENGWTDMPPAPGYLINQQPNGWTLRWLEPGESLFGASDVSGGAPECVHKLHTQLPINEQLGAPNALILDGTTTYKVFHGGSAFGAELKQVISGLEPGAEVTLTVPVLVALHGDTDAYSAESGVWLNDEGQWRHSGMMGDRVWYRHVVTTTADANGKVQVVIRVKSKWPRPKDFFIDGITMKVTGDVVIPPPPPPQPGAPRIQYKRVYWVVPNSLSAAVRTELYTRAAQEQFTVGPSYDDAGLGALTDKTAVLWEIPLAEQQTFSGWFALHYPGTKVEFRDISTQAPVNFRFRPCDTHRITQYFGANPSDYAQYGLPGHEGLDYAVGAGLPYYAVADGVVVHASNLKWTSSALSSYGWHVVVDHGTYCTVYAHAQVALPVSVGQHVAAGHVVGKSGNTGYSTGYHLHFGLLDKIGKVDPANGYPNWIFGRPVNPLPFLAGRLPPPAGGGNALLGLHASADPGDLYGRTAEVDEFGVLRPGVIKVLSACSAGSIAKLHAKCPTASHWIIRAFMSFANGRRVTPQQFITDTLPDTRRAVATLVGLGVNPSRITIELHNEPNLRDEGWVGSWLNGAEFGVWLVDVLQRYRNEIASVRYMYPGLSPGGDAYLGEQQIRANSAQFLADSATAVKACDELAAHCYWSQGWPMATALTHLDTHKAFGKAVWITEASRNDRPTIVPNTQYASEYVEFWQHCQRRAWVRGVTYFVASASNAYFSPECWIENVEGGQKRSKGIAATMRNLIGAG